MISRREFKDLSGHWQWRYSIVVQKHSQGSSWCFYPLLALMWNFTFNYDCSRKTCYFFFPHMPLDENNYHVSCILFCDEWSGKTTSALLPLQIVKAVKQQSEWLSNNHICNYDNVNWACQGWIISGETVNIPNKAFLSGKHGALKTVISLLMHNTWLTSHPWAWTSLLSTTFPLLSVGHTFCIAGNLTTQIRSSYFGLGL